MKHKLILLAFALLLAVTAQAQDYIVMPDHQMNSRIVTMDMRNILELRDGSIVTNLQLFDTIQGVDCMDYGCMFYKIEYDSVSVAITDSVFIEDHDMNYFLLERNPLDNDNVYAKIVCDYDACRSDLRISFFDDELNFKPEKEIWVPISDTLISPLADNYLLDNSGDLVFRYNIRSRKELHIVKMSLYGNEKAHTVIPFDELPFNNNIQLGIFNDFSKEYFFGGLYSPYLVNPNNHGTDTLRIMVLDSLLNIVRTIEHNTPPDHYSFKYHGFKLENISDTTFLVFTKCDTIWCTQIGSDTLICPPNQETWYYDGVCSSRCGKSNGRNFAAKIQGFSYPVYPIDVKKSHDGSVYTAFYAGGVTVAKLTPNLETIWESKRSGRAQYFKKIVSLENGGVAVAGINYDATGEIILGFFVVIFKDECFSLPENKTDECPYTFYPNPANDELSLQFFTDAAPTKVELYDIQGRMVRSQENNFERISLHGLPVGTYALRVSMKDGKQFTSTVVKK